MELWCAVEIGRDFDLCVLPLQAAHKVFAGKQAEFFLKRDENKATLCCFSCFLCFFCAF
jgi:uncharacterized membrane protein